jgi:hypothetical protein
MDNAKPSLGIVAALIGGAAIVGVAWFLVSSGAVGGTTAGDHSRDADLAAAIRELRDEVRQLRELGPRPNAAPQSNNSGAARSDVTNTRDAINNSDTLSASIDRLASAVQLLNASRESAATPVFRAMPMNFPKSPPEGRPARFEELTKKEHGDIFREHLGWTYQQVMDAYGIPDWTNMSGGGIEWAYTVQRKPDRVLRLTFFEGVVATVSW